MDTDDLEDMVGADLRKHCAEHAGWRSDCEACKAANYLFEGEPGRCSLCQEPGHTHDDHWLFQHEPVKALQAKLKELEDVHAETVKAIADDKQWERLHFIRDAAIHIYTNLEERDKIWLGGLGTSEGQFAWSAARALWDAKPEDC